MALDLTLQIKVDLSPEGVCTDDLLSRIPGFLLQLCTVAHPTIGFRLSWISILDTDLDSDSEAQNNAVYTKKFNRL